MRIAVASDHAGFSLKQTVLAFLRGLGHTVEDLGTYDTKPVDYPDSAQAVADAILSQRVERAVLICGSGVGAYSAHQGVEHDHMNVLVLGGHVIAEMLANELVGAFVGAKQSQEERHLRRLAKIDAIEARCGREVVNGLSKASGRGD